MIYVYKCRSCQAEDEIDHPMGDSFDGCVCATCGDGVLKRVYPAPDLHFKGTGWGGSKES